MSDNAYFIGYRIDLDNTDFDMWDMPKSFERKFNVDNLPGKEWMAYCKAGGGSSLLWIGDKSADYRCPIDRSELWEDLHSRTFDFPNDGVSVFQKLWNHPLYKHLIKEYGIKSINVKWGIFLCLD